VRSSVPRRIASINSAIASVAVPQKLPRKLDAARPQDLCELAGSNRRVGGKVERPARV
jgi:hypothetical protein